MTLIEKINNREARIGVIGLGYVGLPLVIEFCKAGFRVTGFDIDPQKVVMLNQGQSYIRHIDSERIASCIPAFSATADFSMLSQMDCVIVCVPTPLDRHRDPDMSFVFTTTMTIAKYLRKGQLIVLESTTYPGTTDEDMRAILEKTGLKAGVDFYLAFSPEREDPSNKEFSTNTIPKVVGGFTSDCLEAAKAMYNTIVKTVPVSSTKVAEATKLLENIYRSVNIALVNELKILFDRMGIDIWEVIEAAKTKPFGFQAFYPGPGLGGHCIPIDPFYLTWKAREYGFSTRFIELAGEINTAMPDYVISTVMNALNDNGRTIRGAEIIICGLAYKANVDDDRESPSYKLMERLEELGAEVSYNDPFIPEIRPSREYAKFAGRKSQDMSGEFDLMLIATAHDVYHTIDFTSFNIPVVDTRNVVKNRNHLCYKC
ncbi:MAG: nucleotide sugar dehydrogenase [Nitrospirae bacterium]|nr:nucleotide sugar dehydrogenase [Nitrospirota bacterium]